jgi:molybdenum cofactor guanylyltransferase
MVEPLAPTLGALILTGGRSARMGRDKADIEWDGQTGVDRIAAVARDAGAETVLTVGGRGYGHPHVAETHPNGGPVAGIVTGSAALRAKGVTRALVLACDTPTIEVADIAPLLDAPLPGGAFEDLYLPLVIALDALPPDGAGWPMKRLIEDAGLRLIRPAPEAVARLRGANTPDELEQLRGAGK